MLEINNEVASIFPILKSGTNSTMFTECCMVAICSDEPFCPQCRKKVIGWDAESTHERETIRWKNATRNWRT